MKRWPKSPGSEEKSSVPAADASAILQVKVWLTGISPMVWRRILVPTAFTFHELHGVIQVATGWEGIHLYKSTSVPSAMARGNCPVDYRPCKPGASRDNIRRGDKP